MTDSVPAPTPNPQGLDDVSWGLLKRLVCWFIGCDTDTGEEGHHWIKCQRCGRDTTKSYLRWFYQLRFWLEKRLVAAANWLEQTGSQVPTPRPRYRPIDSPMPGTKHTVWAYSHEHLASMLKQEGPKYTLAQLLDESGWIEITDDNAGEMIELINSDFEKRSNELEREETMRIMEGKNEK